MAMSVAKRVVTWPLKQYFDWFGPWYRRRVVDDLASLLPDRGRVLDVGCDDGVVALALQRRRPGVEIHGIDVQALRPCLVPRTIYDGKRLPFPDDSFDVVLAMDMLHHTTTISDLLREMARVSRDRVLIKEQMSRGRLSHLLISFGDWTSNVPYGIPCIFHYPTQAGWLSHFEEAGLRMTRPPLVPDLRPLLPSDLNPIFVLEKKSRADERELVA